MKKPEIRRIGIVARHASRDAVLTASELCDWLQRRGLDVALDKATLRGTRDNEGILPFEPREVYDLVLVLGGDGTLMSVARTVPSGVPILGINLGRLGFLTELSRVELYPHLVRVLQGDYEIEERSIFRIELERGGRKVGDFRAFNDVVIAKSALAQIIELSLTIDGRLIARYRADGLIISTPSGSTAYNLSAGGPILDPGLPVAVLTPICPHALTLRPLVVPDQELLEVVLETQSEEVFLTVDGREGGSLSYRDVVRVRRDENTAHLVRVVGRTFYDSLRDKLKWGG